MNIFCLMDEEELEDYGELYDKTYNQSQGNLYEYE